jgi:predicted DNA-binding protein YlxM (UPF0122 family)
MEREREREGLIKMTVPAHGKVQTFKYPKFQQTDQFMFRIMVKSYMAVSLNEKVKVIEAKEKDKLSVREIMMQFKCGKRQIYNTLKQKDKILNEWLQGNDRMKRKAKVTSNDEINKVVWE